MKSIFTFFAILISSLAFSQGWVWQKQIQGGTYLKVINNVTHSNGSSFVLAEYSGTITVDGNSVTSVNASNDIAIIAFDTYGTFLWLQTIGSNDVEIAASIALDEASGSLYVNGDFRGTCNFGSTTLTSDDLFDAFLAKYNLSGSLSYAKRIAWGTNTQRCVSLCTDNSGNVLVTGLFIGSASMENGTTLTGNTFSSNYIAKYNSSGNLIWTKAILGKYNLSWLRDIRPYSGGYIMAGQFRDTLFLDLGNIVSETASIDMFLYAIDNNGTGQWVRTIKGASGDDHFNKLSITDNIYITSVSKSTSLTAQTGASTFQTIDIGNSGNFDFLLFSYSIDGTYNWHKKYGSAADDKALYVSANGSSVAIGGYYSGAMSIESNNLPFTSGAEGFYATYSNTGNKLSVNTLNGTTNDYIRAIQLLDNDNVFVTGDFNSASLSFGSANMINASAGSSVAYVAKYGCMTTLSFSSTPVTCLDGFGDPVVDNGTANVTAIGGLEPYTYLWSNNQTTSAITGLSLGNFSVTVTDANNCTATGTVTINAIPNVSASIASFTNATCLGNNGSITAQASQGVSPYTYQWNTVPSQTNATATNLTPGSYRVTIIDGCMNMAIATQSIVQSSFLTTTITKTDITCNGLNNGTATAIPSGGTSPYTYKWSNGALTNPITGLSAGTYFVTVTESTGCSTVQSTTITTVPAVSATIPTTTPVICRGGSTGTATAQPVNGTGPYTYRWSTTPAQTTQTATGLSALTYRVTITDACGNTSVATTTITQPAALAVTITGQSPSCPGGSNGTATANPTGGTSSYTYRWSTSPAQLTQIATGLRSGINYRVTVTDACGSSRTATITLSGATAVTVAISTYQNPSCSGVSNGWATATPINGSTPYSYTWSNGQASPTAVNLASGNYTVTVRDGCNITATATRNLTNSYTLAATMTQVCTPSGQCLGSAKATPTNGTANYSYIWSNGQTTQTATNLCAVRQYVTVTDANGCKVNKNIRVRRCLAKSAEESIADPTAINSTAEFYIAPNPGKTIVKLFVTDYDGSADVKVFNSTGQLFFSKNKINLSETDIEIPVSGWTKGIYMVVVYTDTETLSQRLLVE